MVLDANDSVAIQHFLSLAKDQGWNWVAFDLPYSGLVNDFYGFKSADEAVAFCNDENTEFDPHEQDIVLANYQFTAISNLRNAATKAEPLASGLIPAEQLMALLNKQGVQLLKNHKEKDLPIKIQNNGIVPVQFDRVIIPEMEVDRFIVVSHFHSDFDIYEIGHQVSVMEEFDKMDKAEQYFANLIRQYHDNTDKNDYQLIGLYRDHYYKYDLEGEPESYCGLTLKQAFYKYDPDLKAKSWRIEKDNDLYHPRNVRHFLYAQYDALNGRFKLLDDRLIETRLEDIKTSTYPNYFINEKFTIKNLSIMNESSYEFVKDQLFYLGFGSEIAAPLREKMEQNLAEFTLEHSKNFGKDETKNVLHFSKGDDAEKDLTFFNRFEMTLKQEGKEDLTQTFFVGQAYNYTLQERYNMLDGRAVYREQPKVEPVEENGKTRMKPTGETYLGWRGLNFKEADVNGNFLTKTMFWNHAKELVKYPIKNINEAYDRSRILAPLERGDRVSVTLVRDGHETAAKVVANPKMTRLDFYDTNGQSINVRKVEKQAVDQTQKTELTPQEVQQQAKAKAAQSQETGQQTGANQTNQPEQGGDTIEKQQTGQQQSQQNEAKETIADEHKAGRNQRRNQGARI